MAKISPSAFPGLSKPLLVSHKKHAKAACIVGVKHSNLCTLASRRQGKNDRSGEHCEITGKHKSYF